MKVIIEFLIMVSAVIVTAGAFIALAIINGGY